MFPSIKKKITGFLLSEDGQISKSALINLGIVAGTLGMQTAAAQHSSHSSTGISYQNQEIIGQHSLHSSHSSTTTTTSTTSTPTTTTNFPTPTTTSNFPTPTTTSNFPTPTTTSTTSCPSTSPYFFIHICTIVWVALVV